MPLIKPDHRQHCPNYERADSLSDHIPSHLSCHKPALLNRLLHVLSYRFIIRNLIIQLPHYDYVKARPELRPYNRRLSLIRRLYLLRLTAPFKRRLTVTLFVGHGLAFSGNLLSVPCPRHVGLSDKPGKIHSSLRACYSVS
jgi:hypothetical protein